MIQVQFSPEEIAGLKEIINRGVLHSGMQVAEAAVVLTRKIDDATRAAQVEAQKSKESAKPGESQE